MQVTKKLLEANYWPGRAGHRVRSIVLHVAEGSEAGVTEWFNNPASEVSAHYLVCKDGRVIQYVRDEDSAWANGRLNRPDLSRPIVAEWVNQGINPNRQTLSIETERYYQERLTGPQLASLRVLVQEKARAYGVPLTRDYVLGHNAIDSVDRPRCPSLTEKEWSYVLQPTQEPTSTGADPGFPGALQPDGATRLGEVNFGGVAVCVEEVSVQVRNEEGRRYRRTWAGHALGPWQAL